jgi:hypothetical protein
VIVGLDLDNTIVNCDSLFKREAERLLGSRIETDDRGDVRDIVRARAGDSSWTTIQADVYSHLYQFCRPFGGAIETIKYLNTVVGKDQIYIISHKTVLDSAGKGLRLRDYAQSWINENLFSFGLLKPGNVYFCDTKDSKLERIKDVGCDFFFDDLEDIVAYLENYIPYPILFHPDPTKLNSKINLQGDWRFFRDFIGKCLPT